MKIPNDGVPDHWPGNMFDDVVVYLLCGHKRYTMPRTGKKVWMHYIGATSDLSKRVAMYRKGTSRAKLPAAMKAQGIRLRCVRVWHSFSTPDAAWRFEKELKRHRNHAALCPRCQARYKTKKNAMARKRRRRRAPISS